MTRTQWRRYQQNKKAGKEDSSSGTRPIEPTEQKRSNPQKKWVEKEKIMVNQTVAMTVDTSGKSEVVTNQSAKRSSAIKEPTIPEYTPQSEEKLDYTPLPEEKDPEYTPTDGEDDFDDYMYDDGHDDTYGENFIVNCGIVSVLPAEYDVCRRYQKQRRILCQGRKIKTNRYVTM